jgi:ferredoxin
MKGNIFLYYFSGTGNSKKCALTAKKYLSKKWSTTKLVNIEENTIAAGHSKAKIHGFLYPVYGFGAPRIFQRFVKKLPKNLNSNALIIMTKGALSADIPGYEGRAIFQIRNILKHKGYKNISAVAVNMPANVPIGFNTPDKKNIDSLVRIAEKVISSHIDRFAKGIFEIKSVSRFATILLIPVYWSFRYMGRLFGPMLFGTDKNCNSCGICVKRCPTGTIRMKNKKPRWGTLGFTNKCEFCLRCMNICPKAAIQYTFLSKGRKRFIEPSLNIKD